MAKATSPVPVPTDPVELLSTPLARSGLAAGATLRRAGIKLDFYTVRDLLFHLPRRYDDLREMRRLGRPRLGAGRHGRVGPGARRRRPGRAGLPGAHPAHDRPARGRHRQHRRDLVRSPLHRAPAGGRRGGRGVRQGQAFRPPADPRQPRVPGRRGRYRAAPRRPDRPGLSADRRSDLDPAAGGHPRGARQGRLRLPGVPARRHRRRRSTWSRSRARSRRRTTPTRSRVATRRSAASPSTSCWRSSSGWSSAAASGSGLRRPRSRSTPRPTPPSGRRSSTRWRSGSAGRSS